MTPWRAMIVAPLLAAAIIVAFLFAQPAVLWLHGLPLVGPYFQKLISPFAGFGLMFLGVMCPAIPALIGVALYRVVYQVYRDWKALRLRARRNEAWLLGDKSSGPVLETVTRQKGRIDNGGKSI